jgi:DNA topoisomerase-2
LDNDDDFGDNSVMSSTPPNAKKAKKAPGPKKGGAKPLADVANESFGVDGADEPSKETGVADKYQKVLFLDCIFYHTPR